MPVTIRPFQAADLPSMQQVRQAAFAPVFQSFRSLVGKEIAAIAFNNPDSEQAALLETLCRDGAAWQVFVATLEERIGGVVSLSLDREKKIGEIGLNAVHPDFAGRGIGATLYEFALARMSERGMLLATVGTGGDASHAAARRAYQKAGFGPGLPSVFLYKRL